MANRLNPDGLLELVYGKRQPDGMLLLVPSGWNYFLELFELKSPYRSYESNSDGCLSTNAGKPSSPQSWRNSARVPGPNPA
jgi:hypothetical protein